MVNKALYSLLYLMKTVPLFIYFQTNHAKEETKWQLCSEWPSQIQYLEFSHPWLQRTLKLIVNLDTVIHEKQTEKIRVYSNMNNRNLICKVTWRASGSITKVIGTVNLMLIFYLLLILIPRICTYK